MFTTYDKVILAILSILCIVLSFLLRYILSKKKKKQLEKTFTVLFIQLILWMFGLILQILFSNFSSINPIYFDYFVYIHTCFLPVTFFFVAIIFARTKIEFKRKYLLLAVIPMISLIVLWTNDFHHLFYQKYSMETSSTVFGNYFYVHSIYTYIIFAVSLFILMKYSIKNSGFFSKQAILIFIGALIPIITNLLGSLGIVQMSIYITPITFAFTVIFFSLAMFKFNLFKTTPIALQRIVDRISDSYIVLNENHEISDFNETFITTFHTNASIIRGKNLNDFLDENNMDVTDFKNHIEVVEKSDDSEKVETFELYISKIKKYFNIEITNIIQNQQFLGFLILFKDITQHIRDMKSLEDNQDLLIEQERLASLGQMIGGIAHNLKTPIMSIAGAAEGLSDLVKEYDSSIEDPEVNFQDHHEIASDMSEWIKKIKTHTEYMSDVITAVKGQAVALSNEESVSFTIEELVKKVDILMRHELKNAIVYLNIAMKTDENLEIKGDVNSLVQIINNMISNSIQAYNGKPEQNIDMIVERDNNKLLITIKDYAGGLPKKVKDKLFKEMITTKGKNGTGLGLYMSYSTIKARFGGNITFDSEDGKGTTFTIILPI